MSKLRLSSVASLIVLATPAPRGAGRFEAHLDNSNCVLCVSRMPFFDAARQLVADGYDPNVRSDPTPRGIGHRLLEGEAWDGCFHERRGNRLRTQVTPLETHTRSGGDAKDCFRRTGSYHPTPAPNSVNYQ